MLTPNSPSNDRSTETLRSFRIAILVTVLLLASGIFHLVILAILGATWHGPLSLRKPALFGISGGMTMWSMAWLMTQLKRTAMDRMLLNFLSIALFIEVSLITLQYWRGVPSHFNRSTVANAAIEISMMGLIYFVTAGIFYLTWRTRWLRTIEPAMVYAIRSGMGLLALSCLLGIATSILGDYNLASGKSYELWRGAGVLKFPHGVALHAIQTLPIVAWLALKSKSNHSVRVVQAAFMAQIAFLIYAVWQTFNGRDRFDFDPIGGGMLSVVVLLSSYSAISMAYGFLMIWKRKSAMFVQK